MEKPLNPTPEDVAPDMSVADTDEPAMYQSLDAQQQPDIAEDDDADAENFFHDRMWQNSFFTTDDWSI